MLGIVEEDKQASLVCDRTRHTVGVVKRRCRGYVLLPEVGLHAQPSAWPLFTCRPPALVPFSSFLQIRNTVGPVFTHAAAFFAARRLNPTLTCSSSTRGDTVCTLDQNISTVQLEAPVASPEHASIMLIDKRYPRVLGYTTRDGSSKMMIPPRRN